MTAEKPAETWSIIEYMAGGEPTMIFDGSKPRQYVSIRRRDQFRSLEISQAITDAAKETAETGQRVERALEVKDGYPPLTLISHPVYGPGDVAYGSQLWLGLTGQTPPPLRKIGAWQWDPVEKITHQGPTIEKDILAIEDPQAQRVSPEVFRHFEAFPREAELGRFCAEISMGLAEQGETFDSSLTVSRADNVVRQAYMTMRAYCNPDGVWALRGIVHDISDVQKPQLADTYDRRTARVTAALINEGETIGIGHMDFATGIVTDWLSPPPAPLDRWVTTNAEFHPDDIPAMGSAQMQLASEEVSTATYEARVRFAPDGPWHRAKFLLAAATSGPNGHGLIRVQPVQAAAADLLDAPDEIPVAPEADEPNDEQGGVLLW